MTTGAAIIIAAGLVLLSVCLGIAAMVWLRLYRLLDATGECVSRLEDANESVETLVDTINTFEHEVAASSKSHRDATNLFFADINSLFRDARRQLVVFTGDIDFIRRSLPPNELESIESRFEALEDVMERQAAQFVSVMASLTPEIDQAIILRGIEIKKIVDAQKRSVAAPEAPK